MSNEEFENYLALVSRLLRLNRWQRELIGSELRDHLETRVDELVESGVDQRQAVRSALEEFGDAAGLAGQFQMISNQYQRRWMMRFATFSILGTFVLTVFLMAMWPPQARFGAPSRSVAQDDQFPSAITTETDSTVLLDDLEPLGPSAAVENAVQDANIDWTQKIQHSLEQNWSPEFEETPFIEVMDQLQVEFGINVVLDHSARDDSLSEDEPVTFRVTGIPLENALKLMLKEKNATFVVMDDVLRIISLDVASDPEYFRRQIFDCRALLRLIAAAEQHRIGKPISIEPFGNSKTGSMLDNGLKTEDGQVIGADNRKMPAQRVFQIISSDNDEELAKAIEKLQRTERAQAIGRSTPQSQQPAVAGQYLVRTLTAEQILETLVKNSVDPEGWDNTNGDGTLMIVGGCMVVSQTESTLAEIQSLLDDVMVKIRTQPGN